VKTVTILAFEHVYATALTGVADLFNMAGVGWNRIQGEPPEPRFQVNIVTELGQPIRCANNITIDAHGSIEQFPDTDLLIVPTIAGQMEKTLQRNQGLLPWLQHHHRQGADIASNCTGSFLLAEAGLLDGKTATTHWGFVEQFQQRFPRVDLQPEQLITADGNVFCSGGGMAWLDLALYLIERYYGHEIAIACAKSNVIDMDRSSQSAYSVVRSKKYHHDLTILAIQEWLEDHYQDKIQLDDVARRFDLTPRTFKRRFKAATGDSPLHYLQSLRIDAAKKYLESSHKRFDDITRLAGYEDTSSFTRLFKKHTGLLPSQYRVKFNRLQQ